MQRQAEFHKYYVEHTRTPLLNHWKRHRCASLLKESGNDLPYDCFPKNPAYTLLEDDDGNDQYPQVCLNKLKQEVYRMRSTTKSSTPGFTDAKQEQIISCSDLIDRLLENSWENSYETSCQYYHNEKKRGVSEAVLKETEPTLIEEDESSSFEST